MINVGIFTGYFSYDLQEAIDKIKALGFTTVQLDLEFRDLDMARLPCQGLKLQPR